MFFDDINCFLESADAENQPKEAQLLSAEESCAVEPVGEIESFESVKPAAQETELPAETTQRAVETVPETPTRKEWQIKLEKSRELLRSLGIGAKVHRLF